MVEKLIPAGDPIGLLADGTISIGTPDQMRPKLEQWRREQAVVEQWLRYPETMPKEQ